ncbi:hypothetical protein ZHAS_00014956 [Anopheles sinensis]|uniref:Uncharacterized protein n=1 Tax=Anopheles sinensis TaxID=74873 RepID=A0A084W9P9_ANOSI|nr:hypothetical protein ZHAS_00014956 [Anopheles sinensis]
MQTPERITIIAERDYNAGLELARMSVLGSAMRIGFPTGSQITSTITVFYHLPGQSLNHCVWRAALPDQISPRSLHS